MNEIEKYESELDYLAKSLDFLKEQHATNLATVRENKETMESLKVDMLNITTKKLQDAAMKTFNHFSQQNTLLTNKIKAIREDQKWARRLYKIVVEWMKKNGE